MFATVLVSLALAGASYLAFRWRSQAKMLTEKYAPILDAEKEREAILSDARARQEALLREIEALRAESAKLEADQAARRTELSQKYEAALARFQRLEREVQVLEESLEMIEFGVYKPHYSFDTPEQYKKELETLRDREKALIKQERAVLFNENWTVNGSLAEGKKMMKQNAKLMLRAFNGECDAALAKVQWNNILKMEERIRKAAEAINKASEVNKSRINPDYLTLKIAELRLEHEHQEKLRQVKEEQKRIQDEMREEEKARREAEKAREAAEKEEARYQKALEKAREEIQSATGAKLGKLSEQIAQLEAQLAAAQTMKQRAISQAQLTKAGHVYIISNIGSFGEDFFKIGMTRRLDPMDRVKELGDASVPFEFDVHAMVYSENAPELERKLHTYFAERRANLVNLRKEFFHVSLDDVETWARREGFKMELTRLAEARDFRESIAIRDQGAIREAVASNVKGPAYVGTLFDDE